MRTYKADKEGIIKAIEALNNSGIVVIPTETVYGLVARLDDEKAIRKIYEVKNRPQDKPLSIFLRDTSEVKDYVRDISKKAADLMKKHWPGPLTLIFKKSEKVPDTISSGNENVGIRVPDHKVAQALLDECGPLVATSANLSGKPSPISAQDIELEADLMLDGGQIRQGQASSVIDVTENPPLILRQGKISL